MRTKFGVACKENSSVASAFLLKEERNREKQKRKTHPGNLRFNTSQGRICGAADICTLDARSVKILVTQLGTDKPLGTSFPRLPHGALLQFPPLTLCLLRSPELSA